MTNPMNGTASVSDDIPCTQENVFGIVRVGLTPSTSKISVDIALESFQCIRLVDNAMRMSVKQVSANANDSFLMREHWLIRETCCLMNCHRNIGVRAILKIRCHTNSSSIFPLQFSWLSSQLQWRRPWATGVEQEFASVLNLLWHNPRKWRIRLIRNGWTSSNVLGSCWMISIPRNLLTLPSSVRMKFSFPCCIEQMNASMDFMEVPMMMQSSTYVRTIMSFWRNTPVGTYILRFSQAGGVYKRYFWASASSELARRAGRTLCTPCSSVSRSHAWCSHSNHSFLTCNSFTSFNTT